MERLNEILPAVSFAAECLREEQWRQQMPNILSRLGRATDVDRSYVFKNHPSPDGQVLTSQRYEWTRPGIDPQIDNEELQNLPITEAGLTDWMRDLAAGHPIVAVAKNLPEPLYAILHQMQGIVSIVLVPIFIASDFWGYMGFDDCRRERIWHEAEIAALKAGANILGAFLQREKLKKALEEIKTLRGILPICSKCKKIRDDRGSWKGIEAYIQDHSNAEFSHGICPECARELYPDFMK